MLNDTQCRNAKAQERPYKLTDGNGLYLEIKAGNNGKVWRYRYELGGKQGSYTIGDYPNISLSEARQERQRARELVKQGKNPSHIRQDERIRQELADAVTFEMCRHGMARAEGLARQHQSTAAGHAHTRRVSINRKTTG